MNPRIDQVAGGAALALGSEVVPALAATPYPMGTAAAAAGLLAFMVQDLDRGAQRRIDEIAGLRQVFTAAQRLRDRLPAALAERLDAALGRPAPVAATLTALDAERMALLPVLVDLHAAVDGLEDADADAARLRQTILVHLKTTADARALAIPQS